MDELAESKTDIDRETYRLFFGSVWTMFPTPYPRAVLYAVVFAADERSNTVFIHVTIAMALLQ